MEEQAILEEFMSREKSLATIIAENKARVKKAREEQEESKLKEFMDEDSINEDAMLKLKELINQRRDEIEKKREDEEKRRMDQFMQEERAAEESALKLREFIRQRKQKLQEEKDKDEEEKNEEIYGRRTKSTRSIR